jgi:hypothetical protein
MLEPLSDERLPMYEIAVGAETFGRGLSRRRCKRQQSMISLTGRVTP